MISTIIFDIGGVLVQTHDLAPRRKWEQRLGLPDWGLSDLVFNNDVSRAAFIGASDALAVWALIGAQFGLSASERAEIAADFWAGDGLNAEWIAAIPSLKPRYKLGILSNGWRDMRERDKSRFDMSVFDAVVYSCEEGMRKPTLEIYQRALRRLGVSDPATALFIDDFAENVAAAREAGLQAVQYVKGMALPGL